jgi:hypothetical protein
MTGSGKTGLCVSLLEEAALDGIPIICIDPKGDLGNLLLTFPELKADDFKRWLDKSEVMAKRSDDDRDLSDEELLSKTAAQTADSWSNGLRDWEMNLEYLKTLDQIEKVIYTPGSNVGVPLTVLSSLDAPSKEVLDDDEALRDQISSAVSGLLALLGVNADPLTSREHILLFDSIHSNTAGQEGWCDGYRFVFFAHRPRQVGHVAEQSTGFSGLCRLDAGPSA